MRPDSCVSRSSRAGRNEDATHRFLKWLEEYLKREAIRDPPVWRSLRRAYRPYRHPYLYSFLQRCREASDVAGFLGWRWYNRLARLSRHKSTGTIAAAPNPIFTSDRFTAGATTLSWSTTGASKVEVRMNAPDGPLFVSSAAVGSSETGSWVITGTCFYLQDASSDCSLTLENTLDVVRVRVLPVITPDALALHEMPPDISSK
jgi:hypothetical protein